MREKWLIQTSAASLAPLRENAKPTLDRYSESPAKTATGPNEAALVNEEQPLLHAVQGIQRPHSWCCRVALRLELVQDFRGGFTNHGAFVVEACCNWIEPATDFREHDEKEAERLIRTQTGFKANEDGFGVVAG